jgi:hypothetical protein
MMMFGTFDASIILASIATANSRDEKRLPPACTNAWRLIGQIPGARLPEMAQAGVL